MRFLLNKLSLLILLIVLGCNKTNIAYDSFAKKPIYENPENYLDGTLVDTIYDKLTSFYFSIPSQAIKIHNGSIISALSYPKNGINFEWKFKKYFGRVRIVETTYTNKKLCRAWIQEIGKSRVYAPYGIDRGLEKVTSKYSSNKACLDLNSGEWKLYDEFN